MLREVEITNNAYSAHAYKVKDLVTQFQGALKEKYKVLQKCEKLLRVQEAKIIYLGNDLVDHTQKLKVVSTCALERIT